MWPGRNSSEGYGDSADASIQQLEELFRRNMNLANGGGEASIRQGLSAPTVERSPVNYSISQHYTHSAHVAPALHPLQPSRQDVASRTLIKNDISPSTLLRSQLDLFENADDDQRSRLIELWRVVPPTYARNGGQELADRLGEYQTTSILQEEELAWLRYQRDCYREDISVAGDAFCKASYQNSQPAFAQQFTATPGQSVEGNGAWCEGPCQDRRYVVFDQLRHRQQQSSPPVDDDMQDEEMLQR